MKGLIAIDKVQKITKLPIEKLENSPWAIVQNGVKYLPSEFMSWFDVFPEWLNLRPMKGESLADFIARAKQTRGRET